MENVQGLTVTSLLLMSIIESGDEEDIKRASAVVSGFPPDLAEKYFGSAMKLAKVFDEVFGVDEDGKPDNKE